MSESQLKQDQWYLVTVIAEPNKRELYINGKLDMNQFESLHSTGIYRKNNSYEVSMYISNTTYAATNDGLNVQFYVDGVWTSPEEFFTSASVNETKTKVFNLTGQPNKIKFVVRGVDGVYFWKVTVNGVIITENSLGVNDTNYYWFLDGDNPSGVTEKEYELTSYCIQDDAQVPFYIGRDHDNDHMYGELFDYRYYKRILTSSEIATTYTDDKLLGDEIYRAIYDTEKSTTPHTQVQRDELLKEPWLLVTHLKKADHGSAYNNPWSGTVESGGPEVLYPLKDFSDIHGRDLEIWINVLMD